MRVTAAGTKRVSTAALICTKAGHRSRLIYRSAIDDGGVVVRGYLHWSALDNYEWGHWGPTFGLIAVDRETFERRPEPSLAWLGEVARRGHL